MTRDGVEATAVVDLERAVRDADIVSCATLSTAPIVRGEWLSPGVHLDLVGAFHAGMRETDDAAMARADLVVVDQRTGALAEGGDIVQAMRSGALTESRIAADLADLARGAHPGRTRADEVTVFKSVGFALEDLAAAEAVFDAAWRRCRRLTRVTRGSAAASDRNETLRQQALRLRVALHVGAHERAPRLDLEPMAFGVGQRCLHDAPGDAATFERGRDFRVMDAHHAVDEMVVRDAQPAVHFGLETTCRRVVADGDVEVGRAARRRPGGSSESIGVSTGACLKAAGSCRRRKDRPAAARRPAE